MSLLAKPTLPGWLPQVNAQVWILAFGQLLSDTGTGFTLFYAPIFFVNEVGLSATAVGVALGSAQISGIAGRFLGGSLSDSQFWGRRGTLLLAIAVSAIASFVIATAYDFSILVLGNLVMGLGIALYSPASEAIVADLTECDDRSEAYALMRLARYLGRKLGVVLGGVLINTTGIYRLLFIIDGISFLVFFVVVYLAIVETSKPAPFSEDPEIKEVKNGWSVAFSDRPFVTFLVANIIFTISLSQINSTLPLYFNKFLVGGLSATTISLLFVWYMGLLVVFQMPATKLLKGFSRPKSLTISALLWAAGFVLTDIAGIVKTGNLVLATLALGILAFANITYAPTMLAFVADVAPENLRGIYSSMSSQC